MKVLVIGGGGREHALVWKLAQSKKVDSLFCIPGNGGISELADCIEMNTGDTEGLIGFSKQEHVDLVVVGPENPLASGIVDRFEEEGIPIFGPCWKGAQIEASKVFAKELMSKHHIPTADFRVFHDYDDAVGYMKTIQPPFVIKADGLCAGKGAYVIREQSEGEDVLRDLMLNLIHGDAGKRTIIEQFLSGVEASYLAFTDGVSMLPLLPSQDHKPLLDGDEGPNTGGMGAYTPIPFMDTGLENVVNEDIMKKTITALSSEGAPYKGVLYGGLMISRDNRPYVIEFNARLGDPETQPILFKMESDIAPILLGCVEGNLSHTRNIEWRDGVSICVVLASKGYPDQPEKGKVIKGLQDLANRKDVMVFHAGTKKIGNEFYTSGGRVLGVTAIGNDYRDATRKVYDAVSCIQFEGMYYRKDIGKKALTGGNNSGKNI
ncbi:phosphoribosylamine--glycine ligase [Syntrophorhabdus aromaticivorans]|nr:phosphoribosylamine--glycine ligase [Syntrophorhabdus aromaticivorans]HBA56181.1 phosphoribosylamine--glycine ligase [Syntrophorhabdus aromaticivorans]